MVSLAHLWLPILVSAVGVFVASSIVHMVLKFWHTPDYRGLSNEDEVGAVIRDGNPAPGMYMLPHCRMEDMKKPEVREKFERGPVSFMILRPNGVPNMGKSLVQWFVFSLIVSLFAGYIAGISLGPDASGIHVLRTVWTVAFMSYGLAALPLGIWWGQPWRSVAKGVIDGAIYSLVAAVIFVWLWPH